VLVRQFDFYADGSFPSARIQMDAGRGGATGAWIIVNSAWPDRRVNDIARDRAADRTGVASVRIAEVVFEVLPHGGSARVDAPGKCTGGDIATPTFTRLMLSRANGSQSGLVAEMVRI
jgi:hypothetical protein